MRHVATELCRLWELEGPPEEVQLKPAMITTHIEHHERYTSSDLLSDIATEEIEVYND